MTEQSRDDLHLSIPSKARAFEQRKTRSSPSKSIDLTKQLLASLQSSAQWPWIMAEIKTDTLDVSQDRLAILSLIANDRFEILKRLGSGSFGEVFLARDLTTDTLCALKAERTDAKHPQLRIEQEIFIRMKDCNVASIRTVPVPMPVVVGPGYPSMIALTEERGFLILAMDVLGPSLEDLLNFCQRQFSKKTVLMLIDQAILRVQSMHDRSLIHRDVRRTIFHFSLSLSLFIDLQLKPDNFLMGTGKLTNILHLIDFGLCKYFRDPFTHRHIPFCDGKNLTGTARYASKPSTRPVHSHCRSSRYSHAPRLGTSPS